MAGDSGLKHADALERLFDSHHRLYLHLYGIQLAKPKFHLCYHLAGQLRRFGVNLNCFKTERMHHLIHQLGSHAKQHGLYERAVLKRVCADMLENIEDDHFVETHLCKPVQSSPELRPTLLALEPNVAHSIASSKYIRNSEGQLSHGDLLAFCNCGGVQVGRLDLCAAAAKLLSPTKVNFVSYQPYALENGVFVPELRAPQWCRADAILSTLVCREGKKGVHILWTWQCMHAMAD